MELAFCVGWKASQNTYLLASEHVNGFNLEHMKPISNLPVPQHALAELLNPVISQKKKKRVINYLNFLLVEKKKFNQIFICWLLEWVLCCGGGYIISQLILNVIYIWYEIDFLLNVNYVTFLLLNI